MPLDAHFSPPKSQIVWRAGRVVDTLLRCGLATEENLERLYRISKRVFVHTLLGSPLPAGSWPGAHYPLDDDTPWLDYYQCA